jgi:hypothetical protein
MAAWSAARSASSASSQLAGRARSSSVQSGGDSASNGRSSGSAGAAAAAVAPRDRALDRRGLGLPARRGGGLAAGGAGSTSVPSTTTRPPGVRWTTTGSSRSGPRSSLRSAVTGSNVSASGYSSSGGRRHPPSSPRSRSRSSSRPVGVAPAAASAWVITSSHRMRTWRGSSIATMIGRVAPGSGHFATGTRGSRTFTDRAGRPRTSMTIWISQRPYVDEAGGSEALMTWAVPGAHARAPPRTTFTATSPIARISSATPSATIARLVIPRPNRMTKRAHVASTPAKIFRTGATGRRLPFATVDHLSSHSQARPARRPRERAVDATIG